MKVFKLVLVTLFRLAFFGVPSPADGDNQSGDAAANAAREVGIPPALKQHSPRDPISS